MSNLSSTSSTLPLLSEFGPDNPEPRAPAPAEALAYCRRLARARQENFPVLSRLVDPALVDAFAAVYAFCRWADDLADEHSGSGPDRARALHLLAWWRRSTVAWHAGEPPTHPVFVALAASRPPEANPLPLKPMLDLIDAFEQDQSITRYQTWDQLLHYCARSANPVGRLILALGGVPEAGALPDPEMSASRRHLLEQSDSLCTALQLTNFWQDVRPDLLERNRIYLPSADTGLDEAWLRAAIADPNKPALRIRYIRAVRALVDRTRLLFDAARPLHLLVPPGIASPVWLFHAGGTATLKRIDRTGCTTLWGRPALSKVEKGLLVARAMLRRRRAA